MTNDPVVQRWTREGADYDLAHLRLRQVAALVDRTSPSVVLDLGCARGMLRSLIRAGRYVGCDFVAPAQPDFEFHRCDFNREPLPEGLPTADVVVCSGLLEYVVDIPALAAQARAHLPDDGRLIATYVNMNHVLRVRDAALGRTMFHHPDWRGFWSPRDVAGQIEAGGFRVVETFETTRGVRPEPSPSATVGRSVKLRPANRLSRLLAHELIYVAVPA